MNSKLKRSLMGLTLAASALTVTTGAQARDRHHSDDAAIAIGAGLLGLIVGAAIADSHDDRYYDDRYYRSRRYVTVAGYPGRYYYYDGYPNRYYRDRYYDRYYGRHYGSGRSYRYYTYDRGDYSRWDKGRRNVDRMYYGGRYDRRNYNRHERRKDRHEGRRSWRD